METVQVDRSRGIIHHFHNGIDIENVAKSCLDHFKEIKDVSKLTKLAHIYPTGESINGYGMMKFVMESPYFFSKKPPLGLEHVLDAEKGETEKMSIMLYITAYLECVRIDMKLDTLYISPEDGIAIYYKK